MTLPALPRPQPYQLVAASLPLAAGAVYHPLAGAQAPFAWAHAVNTLALPLAATAMFLVETWLPCCMAAYVQRTNPLRLWLAGRRIDLPQMVALYTLAVAAAAV